MSRRHTAILTAFLTLVLSTPVFSSDRAHASRTAELQYRLVEVFRVLPDGQREGLAARSINDRGEVLASGSLRDTSNDPVFSLPGPRMFIWRGGRVVTELVSPDPRLPDVEATRINNRGEVTGSRVWYEGGFTERRAFVWRHGRFIDLVSLPGQPYQFSFAWSINDWGEVAGTTVEDDVTISATPFRWFRGRSSRVPVDPALAANALDINNLGQVIGNSFLRGDPYDGPYGGYVAGRKGPVHYLESLPGSERLSAVAINDRGQIIGTAGDRAVLWEDGTALDLGTLPGASSTIAAAINVFGTVVGAVIYAPGDSTAMIWRDGKMRDLNELIADDPDASSVYLMGASDINNRGWIAAWGKDASRPPDDQIHSWLLIPVWKHRH
jgi:probable HAF family extracellular repeat protein